MIIYYIIVIYYITQNYLSIKLELIHGQRQVRGIFSSKKTLQQFCVFWVNRREEPLRLKVSHWYRMSFSVSNASSQTLRHFLHLLMSLSCLHSFELWHLLSFI